MQHFNFVDIFSDQIIVDEKDIAKNSTMDIRAIFNNFKTNR